MASTFTTRLRLEKQATGENANTWGDKTNTNFDLIDESDTIEVDGVDKTE